MAHIRFALLLTSMLLFMHALGIGDADAAPRQKLPAAVKTAVAPTYWEFMDESPIWVSCVTVHYAADVKVYRCRVVVENDQHELRVDRFAVGWVEHERRCKRRIFEDVSGWFPWRGNCVYIAPLDW